MLAGDLQIIARTDGRRPPQKGETVHFAPKADHVHLFDTSSGARLNPTRSASTGGATALS